MISVRLLMFLMTIAFALAGYAGSSSSSNDAGQDGVAGGYGYSYTGNLPNGFPQAIIPQHPVDFNNFFAGYLDALQKNFQFLQANSKSSPGVAYTYTSFSLDPSFSGSVVANSRVTFYGLNQAQAGAQNAGGGYPGFPYGTGGPGSVQGGNFEAGASASIGQGQGHQQAFLNPENPNSPNVNVRFAVDGQPGSGFYGVSSSSSSFSSDMNGKKTHHRHAETVINRNGQVTRHVVHD